MGGRRRTEVGISLGLGEAEGGDVEAGGEDPLSGDEVVPSIDGVDVQATDVASSTATRTVDPRADTEAR